MPLRILTQNLYNGRAEPESLARALDEHRPDIVAVQELATNAARVLESWGHNGLLDPRDDTTGMGLVAQGPATFSRLEFPMRRPVVARLNPTGWDVACEIDIVNAHLMNPIVRPLATTRRMRTRELTGLRDALLAETGAAGRIVVGDLNSSPAWPLYRQLRRIATDAVKQAGTARPTWGPWAWSPRMLRIDHAFLRGPIRASRTQLVRLSGADHSGLLVDIESLR